MLEATSKTCQGATMLGAATAAQLSIGIQLSPLQKQAESDAIAGLREGIGPDRFSAALEEGRAMGPEEAVAFVLRALDPGEPRDLRA